MKRARMKHARQRLLRELLWLLRGLDLESGVLTVSGERNDRLHRERWRLPTPDLGVTQEAQEKLEGELLKKIRGLDDAEGET